MSWGRLIKETCNAFSSAILVACIFLQLLLGSAAAAQHGVTKVQGTNQLSAICATASSSETPVKEGHHAQQQSFSCTWAVRDSLRPFLAKHISADSLLAFDRHDTHVANTLSTVAPRPAPLEERRYPPQAPPVV